MKVINLFAGPGVGKSTTAAMLFATMKLAGYQAELVTEFAKDLVYEQSHRTMTNSLLLFAQQYHRLWRLQDQGVEYAITDSPLPLALVYTTGQFRKAWYREAVWGAWEQFDNASFFLVRDKPYAPYGRLQDEEEARVLDGRIRQMIFNERVQFTELLGDETAASEIFSRVCPQHV